MKWIYTKTDIKGEIMVDKMTDKMAGTIAESEDNMYDTSGVKKALVEGVYKNLTECILPFWKKLKDEEYGGFYGLIDPDLVLHKDGDKGVILHSRILWFFSSAYRSLGDKKLLEYANHAFNYLITKCYDHENGGLFWSVTYDGKPLDTTKHSYNHAFAVYSLSAYYNISENEEALKYALKLYEIIESKFTDDRGYTESYDMYFKPISNDKLSENGVMADKTMNTALHVIEAYTVLLQALRNNTTSDSESDYSEYVSLVEEKIRSLLDCFLNDIYQGNDRLEVFFDKDFNSIIDLQSYGHDIEASWLLDRTIQVLGEEEYSEKITLLTDKLAETIREITIFEDGSIANECERGVVNTTRIWWVQAEAIVGFINYYQKHNDKSYLDAAKAIWDYCEKYFMDKRPGGEWFSEIDDEGKPVPDKNIVDEWKCPYHTGRMCMEVIDRLK